MSPPAPPASANTAANKVHDAPPLTSAQRFNSRLGLWMCAAYTLPYAGFVLVSAFAPEVIKWKPLAGLNLAVWWGLSLIALACLLAFAYGWACKLDPDE